MNNVIRLKRTEMGSTEDGAAVLWICPDCGERLWSCPDPACDDLHHGRRAGLGPTERSIGAICCGEDVPHDNALRYEIEM